MKRLLRYVRRYRGQYLLGGSVSQIAQPPRVSDLARDLGCVFPGSELDRRQGIAGLRRRGERDQGQQRTRDNP